MFFTGMATLAAGWWAIENLGRGMMMPLAVRVGLWGVLVPVFHTVCHRMRPRIDGRPG